MEKIFGGEAVEIFFLTRWSVLTRTTKKYHFSKVLMQFETFSKHFLFVGGPTVFVGGDVTIHGV